MSNVIKVINNIIFLSLIILIVAFVLIVLKTIIDMATHQGKKGETWEDKLYNFFKKLLYNI